MKAGQQDNRIWKMLNLSKGVFIVTSNYLHSRKKNEFCYIFFVIHDEFEDKQAVSSCRKCTSVCIIKRAYSEGGQTGKNARPLRNAWKACNIVRFQRICHEFKFRGASPLRDQVGRRLVSQRRRDRPLNPVTYPLEMDYINTKRETEQERLRILVVFHKIGNRNGQNVY